MSTHTTPTQNDTTNAGTTPSETIATLTRNDIGTPIHITTDCWDLPLTANIRNVSIAPNKLLIAEVTAENNDYRLLTRKLPDGSYTTPTIEAYTPAGNWKRLTDVVALSHTP